MSPLLALAVLQAPVVRADQVTLDSLMGPETIKVFTPADRLAKPQLSPKLFGEPAVPWTFEWRVAGLYKQDEGVFATRVAVFSQESTQSGTRAQSVTRLLMQLFAFNYTRLKLDHSQQFGERIVDVYLCYGGKAGGEQLYDVDPQKGGEGKANTIYLYDLKSFTNPVEMVREVAHEYGHATLPPVGGYSAPEDWSNGLFGEKLYLSYLAQARRKGSLTGADTMGATTEALEAWVRKNVDPLVAEAATYGPRPALLAKKDAPSMDAFLGLALLTARLYGPKVAVTRALIANGIDAVTYPAAAATAAEEPVKTTLDIPAALRVKPIWIPLGGAKVTGAKVLERRDGWARIQAAAGPVVVTGIPR